MTNKDFLSQFSGDNKKPESFKEEERKKITKEKKPINVKLIVIIMAAVLAIAGVVLFFVLRPTIEVKDFVGSNVSEVKAWIKQNEIETQGVVFREEYNFDYDEGYITYQSLEAYKKIRKNAKMDFTVSLGADPDELIQVPDIESMYKDELQNWVKQNKLTKTKIVSSFSDDVEEGAVISYEFKGADAETFTRSSTLNITVSKGPQPAGNVQVNNFVGQDYSAVESWGKQNNITIEKVGSYSDTAVLNSVISQSIEPKKNIKEGETLTVVVSLGKGIKIPDFSSMSVTQIDKWLKDNENYCDTDYKYSTSNSYVLSQSVASGKYIGEDNKVLLTINKGNGFYIGDVDSFIGEPYERYNEYIENLDDIGIYVDAHSEYVISDKPRGEILGINKIYHGSTVYSTKEKLPLTVDITFNVSNGKFDLVLENFIDEELSVLKNWINSNATYGITLKSDQELIDTKKVKEINGWDGVKKDSDENIVKVLTLDYGEKITITLE